MTYGVYTKDLKGVSLRGKTFPECQRYCYPGYVICEEKTRKIGFVVEIEIRWKFLEISFRPFWQYIAIGPIVIRWRNMLHTWADKIVDEWPYKVGGDHADA